MQFLQKYKAEILLGTIVVGTAGLYAAWHFHYKKKQDRIEAIEFFKQARVAFDAGDNERAVELFTRSIAKDKTLYKTFNSRATVYLKLRRYQEALEDVNVSLALQPNGYGYLTKGRALQGLEQYGDATSCFQQCLEAKDATEHNRKFAAQFIDRCRGAQSGRPMDLTSPPPSARPKTDIKAPVSSSVILGSANNQMSRSTEIPRPAATGADSKRNLASSFDDVSKDNNADKMSQSVLGSSMTESQILGNSFTQSGILVDLEDPAQAQPKPSNASAKKS
jgi:tetratricopeptide (TPR) repeat protein